ncbi:MAG TPA: hypothetical protein VJR46_08950 [Candidatus Dormibacteraeota bacterium]|nr:hypothetical protein [Candidatus Dormibacteraeota bacterium]
MSLVAAGVTSAGADGGSLIEFKSMTPITGAAVGAVNDRGIKGGGLPWAITSGKGEVGRNGEVEVKVTGLVLVATGANPIGTFAATVSCVTPSGVVNVRTGLFPASTTGDSRIEDRVALPRDCGQPEVFVGGVFGGQFRWFAVSNAEVDDD